VASTLALARAIGKYGSVKNSLSMLISGAGMASGSTLFYIVGSKKLGLCHHYNPLCLLSTVGIMVGSSMMIAAVSPPRRLNTLLTVGIFCGSIFLGKYKLFLDDRRLKSASVGIITLWIIGFLSEKPLSKIIFDLLPYCQIIVSSYIITRGTQMESNPYDYLHIPILFYLAFMSIFCAVSSKN